MNNKANRIGNFCIHETHTKHDISCVVFLRKHNKIHTQKITPWFNLVWWNIHITSLQNRNIHQRHSTKLTFQRLPIFYWQCVAVHGWLLLDNILLHVELFSHKCKPLGSWCLQKRKNIIHIVNLPLTSYLSLIYSPFLFLVNMF